MVLVFVVHPERSSGYLVSPRRGRHPVLHPLLSPRSVSPPALFMFISDTKKKKKERTHSSTNIIARFFPTRATPAGDPIHPLSCTNAWLPTHAHLRKLTRQCRPLPRRTSSDMRTFRSCAHGSALTSSSHVISSRRR
jgi:hypothetical protein